MIDSILDSIDVSFKWILLCFNFITIVFVYLHKRNNKQPRQHSILFVTAHPDDECMFFRPTITNLIQTYIVHVLCLSGKGTAREGEFGHACQFMGVDRYVCVGDEKLVDGMKEKWCHETIRKIVSSYVIENNIKAIFTFDGHGVSGHPNHIAIHSSLQQSQVSQSTKDSIKLYYLQSTCLPRKYAGILQLPIVLFKTYGWMDLSLVNAYRTMAKHRSQFVWYRKLWVLFSRFEYINTYQRNFVKFQPNNQ